MGDKTSAASPPFATKDGKPANQGTGSSGARDFTKDPTSHASTTGSGFDVSKMSRPQSEAKQEVKPNQQEIPAGGTLLKAEPGAASKALDSGAAGGVQGVARKPFKTKG